MEWMLMPLRRYADFSGRSRRMEFWMWQVAKFIFAIVVYALLFAAVGGAIMTAGNSPEGLVAASGMVMLLGLIVMVIGLAILVPDIAVAVRRLHDTDRSGWWILAPLGPYLIFWVTMGAAMSSGAAPNEMMAGGVGIIGLVCLLAVFGLALTLLIFYFLDGTPGPNRFGPDPKGRGAEVFS